MLAEAGFIFAVCQIGAEKALKAEIDREWPALRFAFSRPGFVTFKLPEQTRWALDVDLRSTFARTYGFSLGKVHGPEARELVPQVWQLAGSVVPAHVHTWQRDTAVPGERGFEPGVTPLADEVGRLLLAAQPPASSASPPALNQVARPGEWVLDCVLVEPDEWWIGYHVATSPPTCWPGGVPEIAPRDDVVSRAYWKTIEALEWSRLPLRAGDHCAEIGSSPGGAVQALLDRGLTVLGIDPAEMDESLVGHERLTHVRKRAMDLKRREFRDVKWLLADSNVAPHYTLDSVEAIVTHREVHVRGLLLTLKLLDWALAAQIPDYVARVRSWGF
ncbi:MAG: SAM-dependent methyltransferase, partial [Pirellulaceae bacterium]